MTYLNSQASADDGTDWMAGDGMHLIKAFGRLASAAMHMRATAHALCMVQAMRAMRPQAIEPMLLQASILLAGGRPHEATELVCQLTHPRARAIQSLCAALLGDPTSVALAREAADSNDAQAIEMAHLVLAERREVHDVPTTVSY